MTPGPATPRREKRIWGTPPDPRYGGAAPFTLARCRFAPNQKGADNARPLGSRFVRLFVAGDDIAGAGQLFDFEADAGELVFEKLHAFELFVEDVAGVGDRLPLLLAAVATHGSIKARRQRHLADPHGERLDFDLGAGRDQLADDDVFLEAQQVVRLATDRRFGEHTCRLLEGSGGEDTSRLGLEPKA